MSIMQKLNTLFRARARESVECITEANAIRIYCQEIIDAENLLTRRRIKLATMIATRKDLDKEIGIARHRIDRREQQIAGMEPELRSNDLLLLTARDIAATEEHLANLQQRLSGITDKINTEELALRKLLAEIREHQREAKILAVEAGRKGSDQQYDFDHTVAGQLKTLRETHNSIASNITAESTSESSMMEAIEMIEGDPVDQKLASQRRDDASLNLDRVLNRLRSLECPA